MMPPLISKPPTTSRNDVSRNELKLRQLDNRDKMMRAFEVIVLLSLVVTQLFILARVLENSNYNKQNIIEHGKSVDEHRVDNERVHKSIENLICDIIIKRPVDQVTDGQRKACLGRGTQ